ncbi:Pectinesterase [Quillaja saponaria]|uniref:pectinesterase n=1 Tax=Quillaja saponaria TaxID=32244 RepID=A0AAD7KSL5_QUISA|nr:Pectinesterase [Quillaja saponaria]
MASLLFLSLIAVFLFSTLSSAARHHQHAPPHFAKPPLPKPSVTSVPPEIHIACKATRFPQQCETSLTKSNHLPPNPTSLQIIQLAMVVSAENLKTAQSMVKSILDASVGSQNRTTAAKNCLEVLRNSEYRISQTNDALPRGKNKDARAWMSAALLFQYDCWSGLKYANDTRMVNETMSFLDSLIGISSNALSMMVSYDNFGKDAGSWRPPMTERNGFWESSGSSDGSGFRGGFPSKLTADVTVCKDGGGGCYKTVQEAVNVAPDNAGTRRFGDGMGKTVITGSLNADTPGISTYNSATVGVLGDGFMANGLTFQNTAGPDAHQAVAFRSESDLSVIENCEFIGNQDTLYVHSLRQFYKSCRILGNVDFIFGNSASIFQDCKILVRPRQLRPEKGENNAITAHGRTDPAQSTGFVFQNCLINGTEEYMSLYHSKPKVHKNFLGRPWKEYSRTVFVHCFMEALVTPQGWLPWSGDFALKTLYYGELENSGPGSELSQRVPWSSQIPAEHVYSYSVQNFIQGDEWIPSSQLLAHQRKIT